MPLDKDTDYEFVEVKVSQKIDIRLSLDDLLNAVQQQVDALAVSKQQASAQVTDRLNQLTQLANQVKSDLAQGLLKPPGS
jgi:FixJ family two-component response regulator